MAKKGFPGREKGETIGIERKMGDSSDSVSVDMESISSGGKVPAFPVSFMQLCKSCD